MASKAQVERVLSRHPNCAVCRGTSWAAAMPDGEPIFTNVPIGTSLPGPMLPTYAAICLTCGAVRLISKDVVDRA